MGPEGFDVVGRAEGLEIRLRRWGRRFTQEFVTPGNRLPMVHCEGRDLHLVVDGTELWSAYDHIGVAQKPKGLCLQAVADNARFTVETIFKLSPDRGVVDVTTTLTARSGFRLSAVENVYRFVPAFGSLVEATRPHYAWLPNLKYQPDRVAGQHTFRSPCAIIQHGGDLVAVIPCLAPFAVCGGLPAALDYRCPDELRFGLVAHEVDGHVYYRRTPDRGREMTAGESLTYRYSLMLRGGLPERQGHRDVVRFLWSRYGSEEPQTDPAERVPLLDEYARYAYDSLFERRRLWREYTIDGRPCGGVAAPAPQRPAHPAQPDRGGRSTGALARQVLRLPARLRLLWQQLREGMPDPILFTATANNARTAYGMAAFGERWGDERLQGAARRVANLALASAASSRLFPAVYAGLARKGAWKRGTRGRDHVDDFYVPDSCETAIWLLASESFSRDPAILGACRAMADALMAQCTESGFVPAWLAARRDGGLTPKASTEDGSASAQCGRFLLALHRLTGDPALLLAARRCADFVIERTITDRRWWDAATILSCGPVPAGFDPFTGLWPQSNLEIYWAGDLMRGLYSLTSDERYLLHGLAALDDLLLYQQIWNAPFLSVKTLGGFGVSNIDAQWSDARTALFSGLLFGWYDLTGMPEYFTRGMWALRAAFSLMHLPPGAGGSRPAAGGEDEYGTVPESYGHSGRDGFARESSSFDWGAGSACAVAAGVMLRYGDAFIDIPRRRAYAVSGCRVRSAAFEPGLIELAVDRLSMTPGPETPSMPESGQVSSIMLRFNPDKGLPYRIRINGFDYGQRTAEELSRGLTWPPAEPHILPPVEGDGEGAETARQEPAKEAARPEGPPPDEPVESAVAEQDATPNCMEQPPLEPEPVEPDGDDPDSGGESGEDPGTVRNGEPTEAIATAEGVLGLESEAATEGVEG